MTHLDVETIGMTHLLEVTLNYSEVGAFEVFGILLIIRLMYITIQFMSV